MLAVRGAVLAGARTSASVWMVSSLSGWSLGRKATTASSISAGPSKSSQAESAAAQRAEMEAAPPEMLGRVTDMDRQAKPNSGRRNLGTCLSVFTRGGADQKIGKCEMSVKPKRNVDFQVRCCTHRSHSNTRLPQSAYEMNLKRTEDNQHSTLFIT